MKPSFSRRSRRSRNTSHTDVSFFRKEVSEPSFFDAASPAPFFSALPASAAIHRKCDKCEEKDKQLMGASPEKKKKEEEDKKVQRKEAPAPASAAVASVSAVVGALSSGAQALPLNLAYHFGSRMDHDFGDAKIHTGSLAARSAKSINARAYTLGNHIVFGEGQYQPDTYEGKKLLAHELAHVVQQSKGPAYIYRMSENSSGPITEESAVEEQPVMSFGTGEVQYENKRDFANCEGVSVQGHTDANYSHTYSFSGETTTSTNCDGCSGANCISETGTIDSTFTAAPTVTLPSPPAGLSECETAAVQAAIDTTLAAHEQQHVDAFNTYAGSESTAYTYNGCKSGKNAFIRARHNAIESARRAASNALSAALDPFNMTIPCDCPDPATPEAAP